MGQFYNVTSAQQAGTWRSRFANGEQDDMQDWFLKVENVDKPVKTTTKVGNQVNIGQTYGTMEEFVSKRTGNPYFKFKREQAPDGQVTPPETVIHNDGEKGLLQEVKEIVEMNNVLLKMLNGEQEYKELKNDRGDDSAKSEVVLDDIDDEPVDLSDIPF